MYKRMTVVPGLDTEEQEEQEDRTERHECLYCVLRSVDRVTKKNDGKAGLSVTSGIRESIILGPLLVSEINVKPKSWSGSSEDVVRGRVAHC